MNLLASNILHYLLRNFGTRSMRQASFDAKYKTGDWRLGGDSRLARVVERYSAGGLVVVLGCGACGISRELKPGSFSSIHGVDFSPEAIRMGQAQKLPNCTLEVGDMAEFSTDAKPMVVAFPESIYYLTDVQRRALLLRLASQLAPGGVIMASIADARRYAKIFDEIWNDFLVLEDITLNDAGRRLVVFRKH